jgi:hypothetical protein
MFSKFNYQKPKYRNKKVTMGGVIFDSKKEAKIIYDLQQRQDRGEIKNLKLKPKFVIIPKTKTERKAVYTPEAEYQENGKKIVIEVKSQITAKEASYILRKKLFKLNNPDYEFIEII